MALSINENKGVIYLQGNINSTNSMYVKQHIEFAMATYRELTLDIKEIHSMDIDGMLCLKNIQEFAKTHFRQLSIVKGSRKFDINTQLLGA